MSYIELVLTAFGLSADAFAVSLCQGFEMKKEKQLSSAYIMAFFFGLFQALMPIMGYYAGMSFNRYISEIDHWVVFLILAYIGGKMIYSAFSDYNYRHGNRTADLLILCIATSIDALAVGVSFSFLQNNIYFASAVVGIITFTVCLVGVMTGRCFGSRLGYRAQLMGGIILGLIGLKILLEHLGIF
ncbi:MAG: manganese efflux pump [Ruminococcaceae bacterium]|nr:manganese efflux pump [Oscillospiraceae bacterium]